MADKKKSGKKKQVEKKKGEKETKSALMRGIESSKKQKAAAIKSKPKKKPATQQQQQQQKEKQGGLREYFKGVRIETKKVVWPTRKELVSYTIVVFIACAFFGLFLWAVDTGFLAIIREVFAINMN
jgi:preprotein translocase subunit SecE